MTEMTMKRLLLLGLGASMFGGCYSGADDAPAAEADAGDRYGKSCYYSYTSESSRSYSASSNGNASEAQVEVLTLTAQADPVSGSGGMQAALQSLRTQAALVGAHHVQLSCWEADDLPQRCGATCGAQGMIWNQEVVVCDECVFDKDGNIDCGEPNGPLKEALNVSWSGQQPWLFTDQEQRFQLVLYPPQLIPNPNGGVVLQAEVKVRGFCFCACTY